MKVWVYFTRAPIRVIRISRRRQTIKLKKSLLKIKLALAQEKSETAEMLVIYKKYTQRQATKDEMKLATEQF